MIEIKVQNPESKESFDKAMRLFKKACQNDGFMQELKERKYYMKPSDKRRMKLRKSKRDKQ